MTERIWPTLAAALLLSAAPTPAQLPKPPAGAPIVQPGAPGQKSKKLSPEAARTPQRGPTEADTKFMQGMILHHSQAVEMTALLRTRTQNQALGALGERISISQTDEIQYMRQWLEDRGKPVPTEHDMMAHAGHNMPRM